MSKKARKLCEDEILARKIRTREGCFYWQHPADGGRRSLDDLAEMIHVSSSQLRQWNSKDPKFYPNDNHLEYLSKAFEKPLSWFSAESLINDPYRKYELPSQATELTENTIEPYFNLTGVDKSFLQAVRNMTDFDKLFPVWSPMVQDSTLIYRRLEPIQYNETAQAEQGLYQIVLSDKSAQKQKRIFLTRADAIFLKELQDRVKSLIESEFQRKRIEREKEVQAARRAAIELKSNNEISVNHLTTAEMQRLDKGLTAPTLQQLEELPAKDEWLDYLANDEKPKGFNTGEEFEAWKKQLLDSVNNDR